MAILSTVVLCTVVPYIIWKCQCLFSNYLQARKSGYPVFICPADTANFLWMIFSVALRPYLSKILPTFAYDRIKASIYGWEFLYRYEPFAKLGSSFILVTPGKNELWVADPETANSILARRTEFHQLEISSIIMGMFGPNVNTADGDDWKRHRRIVAPLLNERISRSVWIESTSQASEMLETFTSLGSKSVEDTSPTMISGETDSTIAGVRSIAINVLGAVAYGTPKSWRQEPVKPPPGYKLSYMESILTVVENLLPAAIIPVKLLLSPVMPASIQRVGYAVTEFRGHVKKLLETERQADRPDKGNLMSTLIRVSDAGHNDRDSKNKLFLSEDELSGHLFQFTIAGFDTTANTMAYAITLLAIYPEWQDWIHKELDQEVPSNTNLDYESTYPVLKRCLALMFEVLRLYTPVAHISRSTSEAKQITTEAGDFQVPPNSTSYISAACMHVSPAIWGSDALDFRPDRWLKDDGTFYQPPKASFLPWSTGPRNCPGQKMAEVEFVAVMMTIFRSYRLTPVVEKGETVEIARERLEGVMADSQPSVTLQMNKPRDVKLRWEKR